MPVAASKFATWVLAVVTGVLSASTQAVTLPWFDGVVNFQIGSDYACLSDPPIFEWRVAGYSAQTYWPPALSGVPPFAKFAAIGEIFYLKLVLSHPGNPCAGSAVGIELLLPAGVSTAISANNPLFCFARVPPNNQHNYSIVYNLAIDPGYGCPQTLYQGFQGLAILAPNGGSGGGSWGMFAGSWLEFLVPVKSTVAQNGSNHAYFRINPDIAVVGYTDQPLIVSSDTIFRAPMEDISLTVDLCSPDLGPIPAGC